MDIHIKGILLLESSGSQAAAEDMPTPANNYISKDKTNK